MTKINMWKRTKAGGAQGFLSTVRTMWFEPGGANSSPIPWDSETKSIPHVSFTLNHVIFVTVCEVGLVDPIL